MTDQNINSPAVFATPAVIHLIENAAVSFEVDRTAARNYLLQACALIHAQKLQRHERPSDPGGLLAWQTRRAFDFSESHLSSTIQVKDVAAQVHLSLSQFFRSFKLTVGMSPSQYIMRRRIAAAQKMLLTGGDSLSDIAVGCGLYDHSHMCNVFRRFVGVSPSAWRRSQAYESRTASAL